MPPHNYRDAGDEVRYARALALVSKIRHYLPLRDRQVVQPHSLLQTASYYVRGTKRRFLLHGGSTPRKRNNVGQSSTLVIFHYKMLVKGE
jgi:hypothetical protein